MEKKLALRFNLSIILFAFLIFSGCKKNSTTTTPTTYQINATLSAANEFPALSTTTFSGTGVVTGTYDPSTKTLQYNVSWNGLSGTATAAHFHGPALAGVNAPVLIPFTLVNSGNSGSASGMVTLSDTQEGYLLGGQMYANVHTAANGGGEIRGQVSATR